ncbi:uncharacterized protein LOC108156860 isoform X1 [Drosophila miranda]|uniref:uncharacterized protein LOC108156860 isoform X1 n=2 Tax=Drosophila miranda TaxID=7229 RepID=UPI0007E73D72|nr:uncharacterized protein LOC108156860 isoform X1 [Drosophila miranda]
MRCVTLVLLYLHTVWAALRNQTELCDKSVALQDVLLSRRVRGLVFPDKASLLLTAALTKIIVGGRPSGLQYSLEFDMYIPLPDTVEGWQPKILKRLRPKPSTQRRWDWYDNQGMAKYTGIPHTPIHRTVPYSSSHLDANSFYQTPWHLSTTTPWKMHRQAQYDEEAYESWSHVPNWKLHRGYRERRAIFDQLEAMGRVFQLDIKSCIKRAMCELRSRLNGGFLMEDLVRIILTVPDEVTDGKYRHRMDIRDCAHFYALSCPYRVLDFLTQNMNKYRTQ